ncbi:hypothetical protein Tco_0975388 [Tanacetum coccineum]|uniref:Uncharacterized protein n=1 Tax=Tanacetum coccineum TaxID=301880 RepID=A0ABQ5EE89_9ASTR
MDANGGRPLENHMEKVTHYSPASGSWFVSNMEDLHPNMGAIRPWVMLVICEVWFTFPWLMDQLPKLCPVNRSTDLTVLKERFEPTVNNPKGLSDLPRIDIFVSTADAKNAL